MCVEYRRLGCSALAKTRIGLTQIINSPKHNHTSSIAKVNYLKIEKKMIDRAVDNPALPPRVLLGDICNEGRAKNSVLPKTSQAFIRSVQRAWVKAGGHPAVPRTYQEAVDLIPSQFKLNKAGDRFLSENIKSSSVCNVYKCMR